MRLTAFLSLLGCLAAGTSDLSAQAPVRADVSVPSVEELMSIEVTSASRKEQRVDAVPAAVFVLTQEDIRRSGMTRLPDVLRLVPGVQVAEINANKWAVSVRGFNDLYANKLLVLVDGRTIYNRLFSGVLWGFDDVLLEDIERIEVIRGPGAAVWAPTRSTAWSISSPDPAWRRRARSCASRAARSMRRRSRLATAR